MNVAMDHRGDEMMGQLGQQWNGLGANSSMSGPGTADNHHHTPDTGLKRENSGGVGSSTPLRTGNHTMPCLSESPVPVSHRYSMSLDFIGFILTIFHTFTVD